MGELGGVSADRLAGGGHTAHVVVGRDVMQHAVHRWGGAGRGRCCPAGTRPPSASSVLLGDLGERAEAPGVGLRWYCGQLSGQRSRARIGSHTGAGDEQQAAAKTGDNVS